MKTHHVDAKRLLCPMPVIRLQQAISQLQADDQVTIQCTDPGTKHDIPAWCRVHGHKIIDCKEEAQDILFTIVVCA